nr:retrovirus-related Pol polyprotein from transposon TNT 1-94 [Tanacetum cinerariifolium]
MRQQAIHKFCDAMLKRVLEGLKSYNNDAKHGYVTPSLSNEDVEYMNARLFDLRLLFRLMMLSLTTFPRKLILQLGIIYSYATDDDEIPNEKVSQELVDEMAHTVDEAKLSKVVDEMKEILVSPHPQRATLIVQSCQRDPKAPALSLVNQDLLYLKIGNSDRKSTSSGCQILSVKLVCWSTKKQSSMAISSVKAEYVAVAGCCAQVLWIKSQLADYDVLYDK